MCTQLCRGPPGRVTGVDTCSEPGRAVWLCGGLSCLSRVLLPLSHLIGAWGACENADPDLGWGWGPRLCILSGSLIVVTSLTTCGSSVRDGGCHI